MFALAQFFHLLEHFELLEADRALLLFLGRIRNLSPHLLWYRLNLLFFQALRDIVGVESQHFFVRHLVRVLNSSSSPTLLHDLLEHPFLLFLRGRLPDHDHVVHDELHHHFALPAPLLRLPLGLLLDLLISHFISLFELLLKSLDCL